MRQKSFRFDKVFTQDATQSDMYNGLGISNLVSKVIEVSFMKRVASLI